MTNNEIINVPTISERSNLSEMGAIAPAGADDAKVVFNTSIPASIVKYHFLPREKFLTTKKHQSVSARGGKCVPWRGEDRSYLAEP